MPVTPAGTAIDEAGTIYVSDMDRSHTLALSPNGAVTTLIADPRLARVDAMWIDDHDGLLMPSAQLNRTAGLNGGVDAVKAPIVLYSLPIGAQPARR